MEQEWNRMEQTKEQERNKNGTRMQQKGARHTNVFVNIWPHVLTPNGGVVPFVAYVLDCFLTPKHQFG